MEKLPEIPSEFIEPYLVKFTVNLIEGVGTGLFKPEEARNMLDGVNYFVQCYCGIHAKFASSNNYDKFKRMSDEDMISICKKVIQTL